jgi:hypothetical protein
MTSFQFYILILINGLMTVGSGQVIYTVEYSDRSCQSPLFYYYFNSNQCYALHQGNPSCSSRESCSGTDYNTFSQCSGFTQSGSGYFILSGNVMTIQSFTTNDCSGSSSSTDSISINQCNRFSGACSSSIQLTTTQPSMSCVDLQDNNCIKQHENKLGPCLSITLADINSRINKTIRATHDHLILTDGSWKLFRELKPGYVFNNKIVLVVSNEICYSLNSCVSHDFKFIHMNETFGTMSLITPDDLYRIPNWIYRILKLFANIPL